MYCELGGDVCGEIGRLGHENEDVCMGCMWGDRGWVAENKGVCVVSGMRMWGDRRRLGHEKEAVCIVRWEGMYVGRSGAWDTRERLYVL